MAIVALQRNGQMGNSASLAISNLANYCFATQWANGQFPSGQFGNSTSSAIGNCPEDVSSFGREQLLLRNALTMIQNLVNVHPNGKLEDKPWGQREFALLDPDHNLLTFGTRI